MSLTPNSLNNFKTVFKGGTRANRFIVDSAFPAGVPVPSGLNPLQKGRISIASASLPKSDVGVIGVPYRGRMAYYAGDRQYSVWPIKIYDDNDKLLWLMFQRWKEALDGHLTHNVQNNDFAYRTLKKNWFVNQTNLNGTGSTSSTTAGGTPVASIIRQIELVNCWPSEVGGINFDLGSSDFVTFDVTLTFDYIKIVKGLGT